MDNSYSDGGAPEPDALLLRYNIVMQPPSRLQNVFLMVPGIEALDLWIADKGHAYISTCG
jgi:hypothetical protein